MDNWQLFVDPRFQVKFKYPVTTPQGHIIEREESQSNDFTRVHLISPNSREVYFEVRRYHDMLPQEEYRRHREYLEKQFESHGFASTGLTERTLGVSTAYEYSFQWVKKRRVAILVLREQAIYRIIYDPNSAVNVQILSTIELIV